MNTSPEFEKKIRNSLNLPQTSLPMKADLPRREPEQLLRWEQQKIYPRMLEKNSGGPDFLLHDGPPFPNGPIHFGHVLNKILKDIIVKFKNLSGYRAEFIPGWDCHGLPIEHQMELGLSTSLDLNDPMEIRQRCREFADKFVRVQREEFQRLGIFAQWTESYRTMDPPYEATTARMLATLVRQGMVYRGTKPVPWSTACQTPLAEAEIIYTEHLSPSVYVKFSSSQDLAHLNPLLAGKKIRFLIWTTTPWTLPANQALAVNGNYTYVFAEVGEEVFVFAESLLDSLRTTLNFQEDRLIDRIPGKNLTGIKVQHPFLKREVPIVLGAHVALDSGTGIVHIAPGHGQEDYEIGLRNHLPVPSPVDAKGNFTAECGVPEWVGKNVFKTNYAIIERLRSTGTLQKAEDNKHVYPYCWRSKTPLIFRSTPQYFLNLNAQDLRGKVLDCVRRTEWIPAWGRDRIYPMLESRNDWCLSRQRAWGLPLMAFHCLSCKEVVLDGGVMEFLAERFASEGSDVYFKLKEPELLPPGFDCPNCGKTGFKKEMDILDVWFESGSSWAAVKQSNKNLHFPADLYLEGSDQYRGWFQSSLWIGTAVTGEAPFRTVLTHGFVVNGEGKKISKTAKNYSPPHQFLEVTGAEILRLWVAAEDFRQDIRFSEEIIERIKEAYRKIRNTSRFILGNLFDFNPATDLIPVSEREDLDLWILDSFSAFLTQLKISYEKYEFHRIYQDLNHFFNVSLSSRYLDILKERLYIPAPDSPIRRSAQSTLFDILKNLLPYLAPILSFTAEEIFSHLPPWKDKPDSVFLTDLPKVNPAWDNKKLRENFESIQKVRSEVTHALERARKKKRITNTLDAQVKIKADGELQKLLQNQTMALPGYFVVSQVVVVYELEDPLYRSESIKNLEIDVTMAEGEKCGRCWRHSITVGREEKYPPLCERCARVVSGTI